VFFQVECSKNKVEYIRNVVVVGSEYCLRQGAALLAIVLATMCKLYL